MSDLLNSASLVMIPSGYKEDTVYSVVPSDGSGDLSFTRASNGTRVNSAGLVEDCPWNMLQQSETIGVSPWVNQNVTITNNATTAPNGTSTAEKITENTSNGYHQVYQEIFASGSVVGQDYTFSCYAKASERTKISLALQTPDISIATFDLINGTASITGGSGTAGVAIESVGNGWYRCSIYRLNTTTGYIYGNLQMNDGSSTSYTGDGTSGTFVWGAQLNIGSTAKPYFPTTDRLNVPRLTYQNGGGGCPSLLLEKQSTNLYFPSTPNNSANGTYVANAGISPDGTQNAPSFTPSGFSVLYSNTITTTAQSYTWSVYLKGTVNGQKVKLGSDVTTITEFTLTTDWARYSVTFTASATTYGYYIIAGSYFSPAENNLFYTWGSQIEASSYATSLIPTTSSSATRVADACFKTGISSLIGQTEGVIFADFVATSAETTIIAINNPANPGTEIIYIQAQITDVWRAYVVNGGVYQVAITSGTGPTGRCKMAFAYKQNDFVLYANGQLILADSSGTVPTCSAFYLGYYNGAYLPIQTNQAILFPTRLTNSELASLTTI